MSRLSWDEHDYQAGVSHGVFYPSTGPAVAWNGLISVEESVSLLKESIRYIDGVKVGNFKRADSYAAKVTAFTYPDSFYSDIPSTRRRNSFGFSYRTSGSRGDEIHIVYNVQAQILEFEYGQDEATPFEWAFATIPDAIPEARPSAHLIVDVANTPPVTLQNIENALYGSEEFESHLLSPGDVAQAFEDNAVYKVIDNGDGTFTLDAPDDTFEWPSVTEFEAEWPNASYLDPETYVVRTW